MSYSLIIYKTNLMKRVDQDLPRTMSVISMRKRENLGSLMYLDKYWSRTVKDFSLRPPKAVFRPFLLKTIGMK